MFQKFGKTKQQSEVNLLKILQDRSKRNVFVPNCVKEEKRKNEASLFLKKAKKNEYNRSSTIEDLPLLAGRISEAAMGAAGYIFGGRLRSSEAATGGRGRAAPSSEWP